MVKTVRISFVKPRIGNAREHVLNGVNNVMGKGKGKLNSLRHFVMQFKISIFEQML